MVSYKFQSLVNKLRSSFYITGYHSSNMTCSTPLILALSTYNSGKQEWHQCCPGSILAWCHMWVELLLVLAFQGFFSGYSSFPPSTKTNTPNSNSTRTEDVAFSPNIVIYYFFKNKLGDHRFCHQIVISMIRCKFLQSF